MGFADISSEKEIECAKWDFLAMVSHISPHDLNRIFEFFPYLDSREAQTASGQGLGLYIARKLVDSQGGAIWAESQVGCGLRFSFSLPRLEVGSGRENPGH